jgi:hypothetical protein
MRLRYRYRLDPDPAQRRALARAFGCARVVFNDGLRAREDAYKAGRPYLSDGELSHRLTVAKGTPERAWLGELSAVALQQSLADLHRAYRNYFRALAEAKRARSGRAGQAQGPQAPVQVEAPRSGGAVHGQQPLPGAARRQAVAPQDRRAAGPLVASPARGGRGGWGLTSA